MFVDISNLTLDNSQLTPPSAVLTPASSRRRSAHLPEPRNSLRPTTQYSRSASLSLSYAVSGYHESLARTDGTRSSAIWLARAAANRSLQLCYHCRTSLWRKRQCGVRKDPVLAQRCSSR
ncbi:hypothetical protein J6590_020509 [Homalodisca vitripennis]|nr:hypothetical protein J6590_020509 [Homalodisca vitripennis]